MSSQLLRILNKHGQSGHLPLLIAAAILHLLLTMGIYMTGRFQLAPRMVDVNGIGLPFSSDCTLYRQNIIQLVNALRQEGVSAWLNMPAPLHVKLYSTVFSVSSYISGFTILSAEPLNLLLYLVIASFIFKIAQEAFDHRTAILAATAVAVWPSFLLHTTQLLKDPFFIAGLLAMVYIGLRWITRVYSWREGLAAGIMAGAAANLLLAIRIDMWMLILATLLIPSSLFLFRQVSSKRFLHANAVSILVALALAIGVPILVINQQQARPSESAAETGTANVLPNEGLSPPAPATASGVGTWKNVESQVLLQRQRFLDMYPNAGSNIDTQSRGGSVMSYLLRATAVGFFAPFPTMWRAAGKEVGSAGRLLAGSETFLMYLIQCLAFYALLREPCKTSNWLLVLVATSGLVALGFVVPNIGALYRMRYAFWMLLVVLGARGVQQARFDIPRMMGTL